MRIIDADELKVEVKKALLFVGDFMAQASVAKVIDDAPTIDQWHYPSRGEYPTEKELVLMKIPGCYVIGWYQKNNWFMDDGELTVLPYDVSRWQYIEAPKEKV